MASVVSDDFFLVADVSSPDSFFRGSPFPQTAGSVPRSHFSDESAGAMLSEVRRLLGMTWAELAHVFRVQRRSVHFWASGKRMKREHAERLAELRDFARRVDRGDSEENRGLLVREASGGRSALDLLSRGCFDDAVRVVGVSKRNGPSRAQKVSSAARIKATPPPPADLVDALHDAVTPTSGRRLRAKPFGGKRRS